MILSRDYSTRRFLIADDKAFVRRLVVRMLQGCKAASIQEASSGAEAIELLSRTGSKVDCLLCDWNMEPIDGLQLLRRIRCGEVPGVARDLRIIMLTAHGDARLIELATMLDVNGYLVKPVGLERLLKTIDAGFATPFTPKSVEHYARVSVPAVPPDLVDSGAAVSS